VFRARARWRRACCPVRSLLPRLCIPPCHARLLRAPNLSCCSAIESDPTCWRAGLSSRSAGPGGPSQEARAQLLCLLSPLPTRIIHALARLLWDVHLAFVCRPTRRGHRARVSPCRPRATSCLQRGLIAVREVFPPSVRPTLLLSLHITLRRDGGLDGGTGAAALLGAAERRVGGSRAEVLRLVLLVHHRFNTP